LEYYHFTNAEYGIENLKKRRIKASTLHNLNDPFEMIGVELSDKMIRKSINTMKSDISSKFGILCFSQTWNNPVQWGHYADNHKGISLGFIIAETDLKKVNYVSKRLDSSILKSANFPLTLLSTKFKHWHYEKEYRTVLQLDNLIKEGELYFQNFSEDLKLSKVIIGCESKLKREDVRKELCEADKNIQIIYARPAFKEFKIVTNRAR